MRCIYPNVFVKSNWNADQVQVIQVPCFTQYYKVAPASAYFTDLFTHLNFVPVYSDD